MGQSGRKTKSKFMIDTYVGYVALENGEVYYYNQKDETMDYILNIPATVTGKEKLISYKDHLYLFKEEEQRIYCIGLKNKSQKWYYYNKKDSRKLVGFEIIEDIVHLYFQHRTNGEPIHKCIRIKDIRGPETKDEKCIKNIQDREDKINKRDNKKIPYIIGQNTLLA